MKPSIQFLILVFLFTVHLTFAQEMRVVSGVMKDSSGEPIIGLSVVEKGSANGTLTDINGNYRINAPLGATLVFTYIGFNTREMLVTLKNSKPAGPNPEANVPRQAVVQSSFTAFALVYSPSDDTIANAEGTAVFTSQTPSFTVMDPNSSWVNETTVDAGKVTNIDFNREKAKINLLKDEYWHFPHITFITSLSAENFSKIPKLQHQYVQGRPENGTSKWKGPETGEVLSWGPSVKNLEFDGSVYDYDKNGRLVMVGVGNGKEAQTYNPSSVFREGFTISNSLKIFEKSEKKEYSILYNNKINQGILPNMKRMGNYAEFKIKRKKGAFTISSQINYDGLKSSLMNGSPSMSLLMFSVLTTPPSFDINNGLASKKAYKTPAAYLTGNNSQRSYAQGVVNNPYWLLHNITDNERQQTWNYSANAELKLAKNLFYFTEGSFQYQQNSIHFGYKEGTLGVLLTGTTERIEKLSSVRGSSGIKWNRFSGNLEFNTLLKYEYYQATRKLKYDETEYPFSPRMIFQSRTENNLIWNGDLAIWKALLLKVSQGLASNNRYEDNKILYAPSVALGLNMAELFHLYSTVNFFKIRSTWGYSYTNVPLSFPYGRFNYQEMPVKEFYNSSFNKEILPNLSIKPEKITRKNIGIDFNVLGNKICLTADYYEHITGNGIYPVSKNHSITMSNLAKSRMRGFDADLIFNQRLGYRGNSQFHFIFNQYKSKVLHLSENYMEIPLGGFTDIHTSLIEGQPAGVLVGTAWLRDGSGNMVISEDGYPIVDDKLKILADPNPDYTLGFEATFYVGTFTIDFLTEYRHRGKVWNGTGNVLSYYGVSKESQEGRTVLEYVFRGVKQDGTVNTTPVDFANPSKPLDANRWYRYGVTGVAEDAIQDASWFRINEISVGYKIGRKQVKPELLVFVRNPLLITKYKGTDPGMTLWEKPNTSGLDLFNMPSVTSVGITCKISL